MCMFGGQGVVTLPMLHTRKLREADLPDMAQLVKEVRMGKPVASRTGSREHVCLHVAEAWACSDAETKMPLKEKLKRKFGAC